LHELGFGFKVGLCVASAELKWGLLLKMGIAEVVAEWLSVQNEVVPHGAQHLQSAM